MCGIAGCLAGTPQGRDALDEVGREMTRRLAHRGPDASGVWTDEAAGVVLAHARLSILDLTIEGAQPMCSADGRWVISYNGEVYNHLELRAELEDAGHRFRGRSDTEVLLAAIGAWGLERTLRRSNGMFAFALWDRDERRLFLARDRIGEKPLYYGWMGGTFLFGSELKALHAHPAFDARLDRGALALYLRHCYITYPHSIYEGVKKLPPGTWLEVSTRERDAAPRHYWSLRDVVAAGLARPFTGDDREAIDALDALIRDAVRIRMEADVPVGAFLSGGIDSTTVVALMQAQSNRPVETFVIGFEESRINEARHARPIADHLGTHHHELYVDGKDALGVVPTLPAIYDEPLADPSQIPMCLLARFTRSAVTVSLSGDGGDELFGGYPRYGKALDMWWWLRRVPAPARAALGALQSSAAAAKLRERLLDALPERPAGRLRTVGDFAAARDFHELYATLACSWREDVVIGATMPATPFTEPGWLPRGELDQAMLLDWLTYLPEDILAKVDRASMAVSLEARVPLLDPRVVEFAWRLPARMKRRDGTAKWILRQVLDRYVPHALVDRPKQGFPAPIGQWIRGALRPWATDLLSPARLRAQGLLDADLVARRLRQHLSGEREWGWPLWSVLALESWLEQQRAGDGARRVHDGLRSRETA